MSHAVPRAPTRPARTAGAAAIDFGRVLCGFDGSERSAAAVQQAALLRAPAGRVLCVTVSDERWWPLPEEASQMLGELADSLGHPDWLETRVVEGAPAAVLDRLAAGLEATLVAVGAPRGGRVRSMLAGDVASAVLHQAPCPVLVARPSTGAWPARIVVGFDGSELAATALDLARGLAERLGVPVVPLAAGDAAAARLDARGLPAVEVDARAPAGALVESAEPDDLLVVGSRGRAGLPSLGSVSERVAHAAACSVLVVRSPLPRPSSKIERRSNGRVASRVGDVMSRGVVSVPASRSVAEAAELLLGSGRELLAVTGRSGRFLGLLGTTELLRVRAEQVPGTPLRWPRFLGEPVWSEAELAELFDSAAEAPVGELVRPSPVALAEDDSVYHAAALLAQHRVAHLPVLRGRRLVGTISAAELLRLVGETRPARHPR